MEEAKNICESNKSKIRKSKKDNSNITVVHKFNGEVDIQEAIEQIVLDRLKRKNIIN